jgi:hypothetical protein
MCAMQATQPNWVNNKMNLQSGREGLIFEDTSAKYIGLYDRLSAVCRIHRSSYATTSMITSPRGVRRDGYFASSGNA